jgi:hypothetical protein
VLLTILQDPGCYGAPSTLFTQGLRLL